jgi:Glycosyl transferase family 2
VEGVVTPAGGSAGASAGKHPPSAQPLVTIAIPVYRRFHYLPHALASVEAQEYEHIELVISTLHDDVAHVQSLVAEGTARPARVVAEARNPIAVHWNALVECARGEFFTLLCDDDEIGPAFVSELVARLGRTPDADVAIPRHELMSHDGTTISRSDQPRPEAIDSLEFFRAWERQSFGFHSMVTTLARTEAIRRVGGFPDFPRALHSDDALVIKLAVGRSVVLGQDSWFRWRVDETSTGFSAPTTELSRAVGMLRAFLDEDPVLLAYAEKEPERWREERRLLLRRSSSFYLGLWRTMYRERLSRRAWVRAGFALPFERSYYARVLKTLLTGRPRAEGTAYAAKVDAPEPGHR